MTNVGSNKDFDDAVEAALIEAELFLKYRAPQRAVERLRRAIEAYPRAINLRERLRDIAANNKQPEEAARQCLALASLYIAREDFDDAHDRLLDAKQLDPRISIASGLEAIRRARRPDLKPDASHAPPSPRSITLAGDLTAVSIFDVVQVIENSHLTGALTVTSGEHQPRVFFNEGHIVGAEANEGNGLDAFRRVVEITDGMFDFERAAQAFPVTINIASNTNLMLDTLRQLDEEKM